MRQRERLHGLRQCADLVRLEQDRVCTTHQNAALQALGVRHEEIVADQLTTAAQLPRQRLPCGPVLFAQRILDGTDGVLLAQAAPMLGQLVRGKCAAGFGQHIASLLFPFAGRRVEREGDIRTGGITRAGNRVENQIERLLFFGNIRCKAALIAHARGKTLLFEQSCQRVIDLRAHLQRRAEILRTDGHDHEFLHVQPVACVYAAVQDVHHRHGHQVRLRAAQKAEKRHILCACLLYTSPSPRDRG